MFGLHYDISTARSFKLPAMIAAAVAVVFLGAFRVHALCSVEDLGMIKSAVVNDILAAEPYLPALQYRNVNHVTKSDQNRLLHVRAKTVGVNLAKAVGEALGGKIAPEVGARRSLGIADEKTHVLSSAARCVGAEGFAKEDQVCKSKTGGLRQSRYMDSGVQFRTAGIATSSLMNTLKSLVQFRAEASRYVQTSICKPDKFNNCRHQYQFHAGGSAVTALFRDGTQKIAVQERRYIPALRSAIEQKVLLTKKDINVCGQTLTLLSTHLISSESGYDRMSRSVLLVPLNKTSSLVLADLETFNAKNKKGNWGWPLLAPGSLADFGFGIDRDTTDVLDLIADKKIIR